MINMPKMLAVRFIEIHIVDEEDVDEWAEGGEGHEVNN